MPRCPFQCLNRVSLNLTKMLRFRHPCHHDPEVAGQGNSSVQEVRNIRWTEITQEFARNPSRHQENQMFLILCASNDYSAQWAYQGLRTLGLRPSS
jgi:hypothetical protein